MLSAGLFELCDLQESYETTFGNRPAQKHAQTLFNRNYYIFFFQYKIKKIIIWDFWHGYILWNKQDTFTNIF